MNEHKEPTPVYKFDVKKIFDRVAITCELGCLPFNKYINKSIFTFNIHASSNIPSIEDECK